MTTNEAIDMAKSGRRLELESTKLRGGLKLERYRDAFRITVAGESALADERYIRERFARDRWIICG